VVLTDVPNTNDAYPNGHRGNVQPLRTQRRGIRYPREQSVSYTRVGDLLLGMLGLALLRSRVEELGGKEFCDARVADLRNLLEHWDDPALQSDANWEAAAAAEGYAVWAATYDGGFNPLIELDESVLRPTVSRYPPGAALDAACGTGRWAAYLSERGHVVQGVDESPEMLDIARAKLPGAQFVRGDLRSLPVPSESVDLLVCSLALTHLPDLDLPLAEFARVVRPGGHALLSNIHHLSLPLGGVVEMKTPDGRALRLPATRFLPTDYVNAGLKAGFTIQSCAEVGWPDLEAGHGGPTAQTWCPQAARAAYVGTPALMVIELAKPASGY
jgi:SAM-dependent methyltransferase